MIARYVRPVSLAIHGMASRVIDNAMDVL